MSLTLEQREDIILDKFRTMCTSKLINEFTKEEMIQLNDLLYTVCDILSTRTKSYFDEIFISCKGIKNDIPRALALYEARQISVYYGERNWPFVFRYMLSWVLVQNY